MKEAVYRSYRKERGGGQWEGVVQVSETPEGLLLKDTGRWQRKGLAPGTAEQVLLWGNGFMEIQGFAVHRYAVALDGNGCFRAAYRCGEDEYWAAGEVPCPEGWQWQMGVRGPRKDEMQVVSYRPETGVELMRGRNAGNRVGEEGRVG